MKKQSCVHRNLILQHVSVRSRHNLAIFGLVALQVVSAVLSPSTVPAQTVIGTIHRPGMKAFAMAVYEEGDRLVVSDWGTNHVLVFDGSTLQLLADFDLGNTPGYPHIIQSRGEAIVEVIFENRFAVIDLKTLQLAGTLGAGLIGYLQFDEPLRRMYINDDQNKRLHMLDMDTKALITTLTTHGCGPICVNSTTHEVFFSPMFGSRMEILDGNTLTFDSADVMGARGFLVNPKENKIYGCTIQWTGYWIYDRTNGSLTVTPHGTDASLIRYNPTSNRIHTGSEVNSMTVVIDGSTDSSWCIPMYPSTPTFDICKTSNRVYYANADHIAVLDEETGIIEQIVVPGTNASNGHMEAIAVDQATKRIYVANDLWESPVITVVQDAARLTRPPVYFSGGSYGLYTLDPVARQLVEFRISGGFGLAFWSELTMGIGGSDLYMLEGGMNKSRMTPFRGCGNFTRQTSFETGGSGPVSAAMTPDGRRAYITNAGSNTVSVVDLKGQQLLEEIPVGGAPWGSDITSDGSKLLVVNRDDNTVSIIGTSTNAVAATLPVGAKPWDVAINPSATKAWVVNSSGNSVSVIDLIAGQVTTTIPVGVTPRYVAVTRDGRQVFVTNSGSNEVSVIEAATDRVVRSIPVGPSWGVCALPSGKEMYVGNDSTIVAISTSDYSVTPMLLSRQGSKVRGQYNTIVAADPTCRFAGRLTDRQGMAIDGAEIRALQDGELKGNTTSNAAGDFCVFDLDPGEYDLDVAISGTHYPAVTGAVVSRGQTRIVDLSRILNVESNSPHAYCFNLEQNYPNPFNPSTTIPYSLPTRARVMLTVFNVLGQSVAALVDGEQEAGYHEAVFEATPLASGVYLYRLQAGHFMQTKKFMVIH